MDASTLFLYLVNVAYGAIAIAFIIGCFRWRALSLTQRLLLLLVFVTGVNESISDVMWRQGGNNLPLIHGFTIVEFALLGLIYRSLLAGLIPKPWLTITIGAFTGFALLNTWLWQPLTTFNSNATTVASLLLIALALAYFYKLLRDVEYTKLERNPWLWFNIGVLIYYASSFFLFTFGNRLLAEDTEGASAMHHISTVLYAVHAFFHILKFVFYSLTLWIKPQP